MQKVDLPPAVPELPVQEPDLKRISDAPADKVQMTWIGHATLLIQSGGKNFLTDPVFSERCSAVQFVGPRRYTRVPVSIEQLPQIDGVLISHNHYDHLDLNSILALVAQGKVENWYVPLGVKSWMVARGCEADTVHEMDWWDRHPIFPADSMEVVCLPSQHFSGRFLHDWDNTLWAGWAVVSPKGRFYFAGDTGYRTVPANKTEDEIDDMKLPVCPAFKEIGEKYGPFDAAAIPIGAYSPRWFMSPIHCNPAEAVMIHTDIKSKQSVAMHWGTFKLTDEAIHAPPVELAAALTKQGRKADEFIVLHHGETRAFPTASSASAAAASATGPTAVATGASAEATAAPSSPASAAVPATDARQSS